MDALTSSCLRLQTLNPPSLWNPPYISYLPLPYTRPNCHLAPRKPLRSQRNPFLLLRSSQADQPTPSSGQLAQDKPTEEQQEEPKTLEEPAVEAPPPIGGANTSGGGGFWDGVLEETREIEWPGFNKVLGTTGVVVAVIVGSSIVLLTVNAVLAEISDRVFAGRGVQDFFG
ncbi:hypothetical protein AMTRI_Chr01g113730 [Amborella trichopoda]|uniref:Preprotein translocase subunit SECE1 n=1 Tax=Amborella trichopoda TaxID=13333 RepID=W1PR99_AMBTC|nr:preprotein translocase subunit SECE1 [Amborella trichopoda]ERN12562.1 hypothetical protein AMTR_s00025p00209580 [Amborella trichopoda]|eukprot:XP_006850981.1 preprotein translocase subunit SECE1 [Amborella trichopoda]